MPPPQAPGALIAVGIATLNDGAVAEVVVDERRTCFARLHTDGAWSGWLTVAEGVTAASVTADASQDGTAALIAVVVLVPRPPGAYAVSHRIHQDRFFRLNATGITPARL